MFFFCKQKTAYEMRISDWSSDVCSSDLKITTGQIYWGAVPFVFIQILMVALVLIFPGMVTHFLDRGPKLDPAAVMQQLELPTPDYGGDDSLNPYDQQNQDAEPADAGDQAGENEADDNKRADSGDQTTKEKGRAACKE